MGRKFYRIALGGIKDESLIRGFRRTYIGSTPGVIIQSLKKVKTKNPVFLLDEIDKVGRDWKGDTSSALLEVLDPEQNTNFTDHYLATPFDLSQIMFIATSNTLETIHPALIDRMEVIEISGYSVKEKVNIALNYLIPKQIIENGINEKVIEFSEDCVQKIVQEYTVESGVRNLERSVGSVCRSVAYDFAVCENREGFFRKVDDELIVKALGNPKFDFSLNKRITRPGIAIGLAYTSVGGRALLVETARFPGSGQLKLTGKLGEVMKESVITALGWIKTNAIRLGILEEKPTKEGQFAIEEEINEHHTLSEPLINNSFSRYDIHCHFPAAAIPKDGPSAGVTITAALVSLFTNRRVKSSVTMTGEISLHGDVLPIGGVKEKCIAAMQNGITTVLLPIKNKNDAEELPDDVKQAVKIIYCESIEDILVNALEDDIDDEYVKNAFKPFFTSKL